MKICFHVVVASVCLVVFGTYETEDICIKRNGPSSDKHMAREFKFQPRGAEVIMDEPNEKRSSNLKMAQSCTEGRTSAWHA